MPHPCPGGPAGNRPRGLTRQSTRQEMFRVGPVPATERPMEFLSAALLAGYCGVLAVVCLYGAHRFWVVWTFLRHRRMLHELPPAPPLPRLPRVTVQLPMYNERHVARRVIEAACAIDYPRELLQVQVLDDSNDESAQEARRACRRMAAAGHDIQYLHRDNRSGYKAGALANGLRHAT